MRAKEMNSVGKILQQPGNFRHENLQYAELARLTRYETTALRPSCMSDLGWTPSSALIAAKRHVLGFQETTWLYMMCRIPCPRCTSVRTRPISQDEISEDKRHKHSADRWP
jgi:hypothetical protein